MSFLWLCLRACLLYPAFEWLWFSGCNKIRAFLGFPTIQGLHDTSFGCFWDSREETLSGVRLHELRPRFFVQQVLAKYDATILPLAAKPQILVFYDISNTFIHHCPEHIFLHHIGVVFRSHQVAHMWNRWHPMAQGCSVRVCYDCSDSGTPFWCSVFLQWHRAKFQWNTSGFGMLKHRFGVGKWMSVSRCLQDIPK